MNQLDFHQDFKEKLPYNKFKFKCVKGCNDCCKLNDIALYPFDIMALCNKLGMTTKEFHSKYTRFVFDQGSKILRCYLITSPVCVFFDDRQACKVYDARPARCKIFPVARIFNRDGTIKYYLPREECIGFSSGQKYSIEEWLKESFNDEDNSLISDWSSFINELKNNDKLPLTDDFFIVMFKKIFYDFDNDFVKVSKENCDKDDFKARMSQLYDLSKVFLFNIDEWKKGYDEFLNERK
jgi:Fe-S-cluster containining protein